MSRIPSQLKQKDDLLIHPHPLSPPLSSFSFPYNYEKASTPSSDSRISPVLLLVIVILAVIFFVSGLLHLLVRCLMKRPSSTSIFHSNRYPETSTSHAIQRQLQQLFRLHDSGLEQAFIDALPVFCYKDIKGLKEPFDCAVCLCEFSEQDKLRLLPMCSHAFHINCIDTWLLSNSTCPLCRGTLLSSQLPMQSPVFNFDDSRELWTGFPSHEADQNGFSSSQKPVMIMEANGGEKRVFPVRLGKFRSLNDDRESGEREEVETSSSNLDARRCYSLGSFQYVVGDSYMQVALSPGTTGAGASDVKIVKVRGGQHGNSSVNGDLEAGKKISSRSKGESFSVSKIWLWSKKSRFPSSSHTHMSVPFSVNVNLPLTDSTQTL